MLNLGCFAGRCPCSLWGQLGVCCFCGTEVLVRNKHPMFPVVFSPIPLLLLLHRARQGRGGNTQKHRRFFSAAAAGVLACEECRTWCGAPGPGGNTQKRRCFFSGAACCWCAVRAPPHGVLAVRALVWWVGRQKRSAGCRGRGGVPGGGGFYFRALRLFSKSGSACAPPFRVWPFPKMCPCPWSHTPLRPCGAACCIPVPAHPHPPAPRCPGTRTPLCPCAPAAPHPMLHAAACLPPWGPTPPWRACAGVPLHPFILLALCPYAPIPLSSCTPAPF